MIPLGTKVRCRVTGYIGVAVARIEHLCGVPEVKVDSLVDGRIHHEWVDEQKLETLCDASSAGFAP